MRVLVCGGRDYRNDAVVHRVLRLVNPSLVIHGAAAGADLLSARWAERFGVRTMAFPADWKTHGRSAGPIRNSQMLAEGKPDVCVAFPGGRGTADMVRRCMAAGVRVIDAARGAT